VFEYQHYLKYFSKPRGPYVEGNPKKLKNTPPTTDEIKSNIDKRGNGFNYMVSFGNHPNMERYTP
jgi:hypothetical protein